MFDEGIFDDLSIIPSLTNHTQLIMEKRETQPKIQLRVNSVACETIDKMTPLMNASLLVPSLTCQPPVAAKMEITVILKINGVETRSLFNKVANP